MFKKRRDSSREDGKYFPKDENNPGSMLLDMEGNSESFDVEGVIPVDGDVSFHLIGDNLETTANDSSTNNEENDEEEENTNLRRSTDHDETPKDEKRENNVLEFVKLLENSSASEDMKALLLKILKSNKIEELTSLLKERSRNRSKKKVRKGNLDSSSTHHDKLKKQASRRNSRANRPDPSDLGNSSTSQRRRSKSGTRKPGSKKNSTSISNKASDVPISSDSGSSKPNSRREISSKKLLNSKNLESGSRSALTSPSDKTNDTPVSPDSGLTKLSSRQELMSRRGSTSTRTSDRASRNNVANSSLRKNEVPLSPGTGGSKPISRRDLMTRRLSSTRNIERSNLTRASNKTNDDVTSPSFNMSKSRLLDSNLRSIHGDAAPESNLASSSSLAQIRSARRADVSRRRTMSNLNNSSRELQSEKQNSSWDSVPSATAVGRRRPTLSSTLKEDLVPTGDQNAIWDSTVGNKSLGKIAETKNQRTDKKKYDSIDGATAEGGLSTELNESVSRKSNFAQFDPSGKVAFREQTHGLHDLLDDLRLNRDSNSSNKEEPSEENLKEKKGLRKYLSRQLTKKILVNKDKPTNTPEPPNEKNNSNSDMDYHFVKDLNTSIVSLSLQNSTSSFPKLH